MGEVYRARDPRLGREVAIKVLPASFSQDRGPFEALRGRGAGGGRAQPPEHHSGLRIRDARRRAVHRDGASGRRDAAQPPRAGCDLPAQGDRLRGADRERTGRRAREGDRAPGSEARERLPDEGRTGQDPRLRSREAEVGRGRWRPDRCRDGLRRDAAGRGARDDGLHVARAGAREGRGQAERSFLLRHDPLRDAVGPAGVPRRHGGGHDHGDPVEGAAGHLPDQQGRHLRGWIGSCGTASRRTRRSGSSRRAMSRSTSRRSRGVSATSTATGVRALPQQRKPEAAGWLLARRRGARSSSLPAPFIYSAGKKAGLRRAAGLPADHVLARRGWQRPLRAGRPDGRLFRRLGRRSLRGLHQPAGEPRVAAVRARRAPRFSSISKSGEMAISLSRRRTHAFVRSGPPRADLDRRAARRGTSSTTSSSRTGAPTARTLAIVRDVGSEEPPGVPDREGPLRDDRMDRPDPRVSPDGRRRRLRRSSRSRTTTAGGSPSSIAPGRRRDSHAALRDGPGPRLDAGRRRDLVHGRRGRLQPGRPRRDAFREGASGRPRAGHQHDPRHLAARARADDQRERASRDPRARARRREGAGALLARLLPRDRHLGRTASKILITESGEGGGPAYSAYLREFDGSPAVRLGDGSTEAFSPDGAWAISVTHTATPQILLLPTSVGEPRELSRDGLDCSTPTSFPTERSALHRGRGRPRHAALRARHRRAASRSPRRFTGGLFDVPRHGHAGRKVRGRRAARIAALSVSAPGRRADGPSGPRSEPPPVRFTADGRYLFVQEDQTIPMRIFKYDMATGTVELWKELMAADAAGLTRSSRFVATPDGRLTRTAICACSPTCSSSTA